MSSGATILTLKGGHNAEGHNHIDVGQLQLFRDGAPVIVHTGTMCYDRFTFNERRYERWCYNAEGTTVASMKWLNPMVVSTRQRAPRRSGCPRTRTLRRLSGRLPHRKALICKAKLRPDGAATITDTLRPAQESPKRSPSRSTPPSNSTQRSKYMY
ncbi:MAG: hypothetical protein V8T86_08385, partial [Victivallis sp.]